MYVSGTALGLLDGAPVSVLVRFSALPWCLPLDPATAPPPPLVPPPVLPRTATITISPTAQIEPTTSAFRERMDRSIRMSGSILDFGARFKAITVRWCGGEELVKLVRR